ncbi:hypothetical protein [Shewanella decolorationis]|uniref:hypothetical protein n=1 Tax=Shewanella decolorationis TaxID=256839 RepID=UPI0010571EB5|nr:hypothetical protein [Shewanella decolorationis]
MKTTLTAVLTCFVVSLLIALIVVASFSFSIDTPPLIFAFIWGNGFMSAWFSVFAITKTCKVIVLDDKTRVIVVDEQSNKAGAA